MKLLTHKDEDQHYTYYLRGDKEVRHGLFRCWFSNGELRSEFNYRDGKAHGTSKGWYPNGQLDYDGTYKDGELHGHHKGWFEDGKKRFCHYRISGCFHGLCRTWDSDGNLISSSYYREDVAYKSKQEFEDSLIADKAW